MIHSVSGCSIGAQWRENEKPDRIRFQLIGDRSEDSSTINTERASISYGKTITGL
jgi:hypothetical protein